MLVFDSTFIFFKCSNILMVRILATPITNGLQVHTLPSNVLVTKMFFKGPHRLLFDNCAIIISSLPRLQSHEQCRLLVVHIVRSQTLGVEEKHSTSSIKVHKKQSHELALSQWSYMYRLVVSIVSQTEAEKRN